MISKEREASSAQLSRAITACSSLGAKYEINKP